MKNNKPLLATFEYNCTWYVSREMLVPVLGDNWDSFRLSQKEMYTNPSKVQHSIDSLTRRIEKPGIHELVDREILQKQLDFWKKHKLNLQELGVWQLPELEEVSHV